MPSASSANEVPVFDRAQHRYYLGGRELFSVSRVIEAEGLKIKFYASDPVHRQRGDAIHMGVHDIGLGRFDAANYSPILAPYFDAYRRFQDDHHFKVRRVEQLIWHPEWWMAGTLDQDGVAKGNVNWMVDIKTGTLPPAVAIQVGFYGILAKRSRDWDYECRKSLLLTPNGKYRLSDYSGPVWTNHAISCYNMWNFKREHNLLDKREAL